MLRTLSVALFAVGSMASAASAGYIGSVVSIGQGGVETPSLDVLPGGSFSAALVLTGDTADRNDSAVFRIVFSFEGLAISSGWAQWSTPYQTGGIDDFSNPAHDASGLITSSTHNDPVAVGATDVYFENVSKTAGSFFTSGTLLTLTFAVPEALANVGSFTISFAPDTFTNGASFVNAAAGESLTVNVIPAPAGLLVLGSACFAAGRRRRASAA